MFDTGHDRKNDAHDAHAVAVVAVRTKGLRVLSYDAELEALRMLTDRREELTRQRVQILNRLQRLLSELLPGKGKKELTALQAKAILASVRPRDLAGKTRKRLALEQLTDLVALDKKTRTLTAELKAMVKATGSRLMDLRGVGPWWLLECWPTSGTWLGSPTGIGSRPGPGPPIEASSGEIVRHRLSRAGNRRMNHMIHIAATTQIRLDTPGRAFYLRKIATGKTRAEGKKPMEALRCAASNAGSAMPSIGSWSPTLNA